MKEKDKMNKRRERISKLLRENFSLHELIKILLNKKNLLTDENLDLLEQTVQKFEEQGISHDDLMDIGTIGMIKAIQRFDSTKGQTLEEATVAAIDQEINDFFKWDEKEE